MRFFYSFLFFFIFNFSYGFGGPDAYGYVWYDSNDSLGPNYAWCDILSNNQTQQILGLGDDNFVGAYKMHGNFMYYWYSVDEFFVASNGYISFEGVNIASPFPYIPDSLDGKHNFIAALMSDLNFSGSGNNAECYYLVSGDSVIISYYNVPFWNQTFPYYSGSNTFQFILNKSDYSITINYQNQTGMTMNDDITIGIENINGNIGLMHSKNIYPLSGYSVKYIYPSNPSLLVTDAGVNWNDNEGNDGVFISYPNNGYALQTNIQNKGNQPLSSFQVNAEIMDPNSNLVVNSAVLTTGTLSPPNDTLIVFSNTFTPNTTGTHNFTTYISNVNGDMSVSNDMISHEIVVVDTSQFSMNLSYTDQTPDGAGLSWSGGTGGIGVYFEPPFYPVEFNSVDLLFTSNIWSSACYIKIYDDDGPFGSPGTLLDSLWVSGGQIQVGNITNVSLNSSIAVNDGGFYILWLMNGPDLQLATDATPPFSYQTYEVLGGIWSDYRSLESTDFFISANINKIQPIVSSWDCVNGNCIDPGNGSGLYQSLSDCQNVCSGTSIEENKINFKIYPNPTTDFVQVSCDTYYSLNIYDINSKLHFSVKNLKGNKTIDISNLQSGNYLFEIIITDNIFREIVFKK